MVDTTNDPHCELCDCYDEARCPEYRKAALIELMRDSEELGLYEVRRLSAAEIEHNERMKRLMSTDTWKEEQEKIDRINTQLMSEIADDMKFYFENE